MLATLGFKDYIAYLIAVFMVNWPLLSRSLAQVGLVLLLQSTLLLSLGLRAAVMLGRKRPIMRSLIYRTTLSGVVLAAVCSLALAGRIQPLWTLSLPSVKSASDMFRTQPLDVHYDVTPTAKLHVMPAPSGPPPASPHIAAKIANSSTLATANQPSVAPVPSPNLWTPDFLVAWFYLLIASIWLYGIVLQLLWLLCCQLYMLRLRRRSAVINEGEAATSLRQLCAAHQLQAPLLLASSQTQAPLLTGLWRPAILLPNTYATQFDSNALKAIFLHELAHLERHDCAWNLLARLARILLWPQPLLWMLCRRMEQASEEVCDEAVINGGCPPREYAQCLLDLTERLALKRVERTVGAGVIPLRSTLSQRVRHILECSALGSRPISARLRLATTMSAICAGVVAAMLIASATTPYVQRAHGVIRGRVLYEDGRPAAGIKVSVTMAHDFEAKMRYWIKQQNREFIGSTSGLTRTRSDGSFELGGLASGHYDAQADAPSANVISGQKLLSWLGKPLLVATDDYPPLTPANIILMPTPTALTRAGQSYHLPPGVKGTAAITGRVMFEDGRPAIGIKVIANSNLGVGTELWGFKRTQANHWRWPPQMEHLLEGITTTRADGSYRITGLMTAKYAVSIGRNLSGSETPLGWVNDGTHSHVSAQEGQTVHASDLVIMRGAVVRIKVVDNASGKPLAEIDILGYNLRNATDTGSLAATTYDGHGHYVPSKGWIKYVNTDKFGICAMNLEPGKASFRIQGGGPIMITAKGLKRKDPIWNSTPGASPNAIVKGKDLYAMDDLVGVSVDNAPLKWTENGETTLHLAKGQVRQVTLRMKRYGPTPPEYQSLIHKTSSTSTIAPNPKAAARVEPPPALLRSGTGIIEGRVIYAGGKPAAGVRVIAEMQRVMVSELIQQRRLKMTPGGQYTQAALDVIKGAFAITGQDGTFRLTGLTTAAYNWKLGASSGPAEAAAGPPGWVSAAIQGVWAKDGQTVRRASPIILTHGAVIEGQVLDSQTHAPLPGIKIASYGPHRPRSGDSVIFSKTDRTGHYALRVAPGQSEFYIYGPWSNASEYIRYADEKKILTNIPGTGKVGNSFYDITGPAKIVVDHGQPQFSHYGPSQMTRVKAGEGETHTVTFYLRRMVQEIPKPLPMPEGTGHITGRVLHADGTPAVGVRVIAQMNNTYQNELCRRVLGTHYFDGPFPHPLQRVLYAIATTNAKGTYQLTGLTTAPYTVELNSSGYPIQATDTSSWTAIATSSVPAKEHAVATAPTLTLIAGAILQGQLVDAANQQPLDGLTVVCYDPAHPPSGTSFNMRKTGSNGQFSFRVAPGKSYFAVVGPGRGLGQAEFNLSATQAQAFKHPYEGIFAVRHGDKLYAAQKWVQLNLTGGPPPALKQDWIEVTTAAGQNLEVVLGLKRLTLKTPKSGITSDMAEKHLQDMIPQRP